MWLRIASDLHLEFFQPYQVDHYEMFPPDDRDKNAVLILAGDIVLASKMKEYLPFFRELGRRFESIIFITGNHEYYSNSFQGAHDAIEAVLKDKWLNNYHWLKNNCVGYGDVMIWGATLWTDMNRQHPICMMQAAGGMPEFRGSVVWDAETREMFTPDHSVRLHNESIYHLKEFFRNFNQDHQRHVIVTHHAPSYESVGAMYKGSDLNGAFASELSHEILEREPVLWIHGHMHDPSDYMIGESRIICNPLGYPNHGKEGKYFNNKLFIEV